MILTQFLLLNCCLLLTFFCMFSSPFAAEKWTFSGFNNDQNYFELADLEPSDFYLISLPNIFLPDYQHTIHIQVQKFPLRYTILTSLNEKGPLLKEDSGIISDQLSGITYRTPDHPSAKTIYLTFIFDQCSFNKLDEGYCHNRIVLGNYLKKTFQINMMVKPFFIHAETSKSVYRPGETVAFRFFTIYLTQLMSENPSQKSSNITQASQQQYSVFDQIYIENPDRHRLFQWDNVTKSMALNMFFPLDQDCQKGVYKVTATHNSKRQTHLFEVKEYTKPAFLISILPPKSLTVNDKIVTFGVCSIYPSGRSSKGIITTQLCLQSRFSKVNKRPCIVMKKIMTGKEKCLEFETPTKSLQLRSRRFKYWNVQVNISVSVEEDGTGVRLSKTSIGPTLSRSDMVISVDCPTYYKPYLPFYGIVHTKYPNGSIYPNARVQITVQNQDYPRKQAHFSEYFTSNEYGFVSFQLPDLSSTKDYILEVNQIREDEPLGYYVRMVPAFFTKILVAWKSDSNLYLQVRNLKQLINASETSCQTELKLHLQSNNFLADKTLYVQTISKGQILTWNKIQLDFNVQSDECKNQNNPELGHYTCINKGSIDTIKCLPGWTGDNCLKPACKKSCNSGLCLENDRCLCPRGWKGQFCEVCVTRRGCKHGSCSQGNDCVCLQGWHGYLCDRSRPLLHSMVKNEKFVLFSKQTQFSRRDFTRQKRKISTNPETSIYQRKTIFSRTITIPITENLAPKSSIIIYFVTNYSAKFEIVAEYLEFENLMVCKNKPDEIVFRFSSTVAIPGSSMRLHLGSLSKRSNCSLHISDVGYNKSDVIITDRDRLERQLDQLETGYDFASHYRECLITNAAKNPLQFYFSPRPFSAQSFHRAGFSIISNANDVDTICQLSNHNFRLRNRFEPLVKTGFNNEDSKNTNTNENDKKEKNRNIERSFFPEIWKFEYLEHAPSSFNLRVPDSITIWRADMHCETPEGLWIPPPTFLEVKLPFHTSVHLPDVFMYNEITQISVRVFSNLQDCFGLNITLEFPENEMFIHKVTNMQISDSLCNMESKIVGFMIMVKKSGPINLIVNAQLKSLEIPYEDSDDSVKRLNYSDKILKKIFVQQNGVLQRLVESDLVCLKNDESEQLVHTLNLPLNIDSGSMRRYVSYTSDIMGINLSDVTNLVNIPYEYEGQNIVGTFVSTYALNFLKFRRIHPPKDLRIAQKLLNVSYEKQIKRQMEDGSFAGYGLHDIVGSTWLTSFALASFIEARDYLNVSEDAVQKSVQLLHHRQFESGCFFEKGPVLNPLMQKPGDFSGLRLTAYILMSLKLDYQTSVLITGAMECITRHLQPFDVMTTQIDNYTLALIAYGFTLHKPNTPFTTSLLKLLINRRINLPDKIYWSDNLNSANLNKNDPIEIETTAYAYLALQKTESSAFLIKIIRWLLSHQKAAGGFYSTHDTVAGLRAILQFVQTLEFEKETKIEVYIYSTKQDNSSMSYPAAFGYIDSENKLVNHKQLLIQEENESTAVKWILKGNGCIYIESSIFYPTQKSSPSSGSAFEISAKVIHKIHNPSEAVLSVCLSQKSQYSNQEMVLLTVNGVTDWVLDPNIQNTKVPLVKFVEAKKDKLNIYLNSYFIQNNSPHCLHIDMINIIPKNEPKKGLIHVVDYNEPEKVATAWYEVKYQNFEAEINARKNIVFGCPICLLEPKDIESLRVQNLLQNLLCDHKINSAIAIRNGTEETDNPLYTFLVPKDNHAFFEWMAPMKHEECECMSKVSNAKEDLIILKGKQRRLIPGQSLKFDNDMVVTKVSYIDNMLKRRVFWSLQCLFFSPFRRLLHHVYPPPTYSQESVLNESTSQLNKSLQQQFINDKCPQCIKHYGQSDAQYILPTVCNRKNFTLFQAKISPDQKGWSMTWTVTPSKISRSMNNVSIRINPKCDCNMVDNSSDLYNYDLRLVTSHPVSDLIRNMSIKRLLNIDARFIVTNEAIYERYLKQCEYSDVYNEWLSKKLNLNKQDEGR